jgi:hypothetical protein
MSDEPDEPPAAAETPSRTMEIPRPEAAWEAYESAHAERGSSVPEWGDHLKAAAEALKELSELNSPADQLVHLVWFANTVNYLMSLSESPEELIEMLREGHTMFGEMLEVAEQAVSILPLYQNDKRWEALNPPPPAPAPRRRR